MDQSARTVFIEKFLTASFTQEEHTQFVNWVNQADKAEVEAAWELFSDMEAGYPDHGSPPADFREAMERRLDLADKPRRIQRFGWYAAASVLVAVAGFAVYYFTSGDIKDVSPGTHITAQTDVLPGGNKATLILSGGKSISLDDVSEGDLAMENGVNIRKNAGGQLRYSINNTAPAKGAPVFNTITTPRGGQYQVGLPDGSVVWLNAASSLSFPVNFSGTQRKVKITGEAFFDIRKDKNKPFIVETGNQELEVLGTSFNINSYRAGSISTSLIDGSVKLTNTASLRQLLLQPGWQAVLNKEDIFTQSFNIENVTSWRKGLFSYTNASLNTVMDDFERWYDVDVVYEGKVPDFDFTGDIPRKLKASQFLEIMSSYPVKFSLEAIGDKQRLTVSAR